MKLLAVLAGYLGPWVWAAVLGVLLATHGAVAFWVHAEVTEKWELREAKAKEATARAVSIEQAKQREIEQRWQTATNQATEALTDARRTIAEQARRIDSLRLDAGSLRNQLATYAAGRAGEDPAAARDRGAVLAAAVADGAELLAEGAGLLATCARAHDERAAEVTALLRAWPR